MEPVNIFLMAMIALLTLFLAGIGWLYYCARNKNALMQNKLNEKAVYNYFPELSPHPTLRFDDKGVLLYANKASKRLMEYWKIKKGNALPSDWQKLIKDIVTSRTADDFDIEYESHAFLVTFVHVPGTRMVNCYGLDVTEKQQAMHEAMKKTLYDSATHLPNRVLVLDYLKLHAERLKPKHKMFVFMVSIADLTEIASMLPDTAVNEVMVTMAQILEMLKSSESTLGKPSDRSFVLIDSELFNHGQAINIAQRILNAFSNPLEIQGYSILPKITIGISCYPDDSQNPEIILRNAKLAQSRGLAQKMQVLFYQSDMDEQVQAKRKILVDLHSALSHHELMIYYQPQWSISQGRFIGAEALLRWKHPTKGFISPFFFVAAAEESGLIIPIGQWVLEATCKDAAKLKAMNIPFKTAINLSAVQFMQEDIVGQIVQIIDRYGLTPDLFELEITEGVVIQDYQKAIQKMHELRKAGFSLSIDDFGTGYSSLSYLQQFPVQKLKIDRAFVKDIDVSAQNFNMTRGIIELGHSLNLSLVAEGVENENQVVLLQKMKCDIIQGYYFSKPIPFEQMLTLIQS